MAKPRPKLSEFRPQPLMTDARVRRRLRRLGWRTAVVWEHEVRRSAAGAAALLRRVRV